MSGQDWGGVEIRVTPAALKQKAAELNRRIDRASGLFSQLESAVRGTRRYWIGEAGELHRQDYQDKKDDITRMLRRLREHPVDLMKISGNYEAAEEEIVENVSALRDNVIQ